MVMSTTTTPKDTSGEDQSMPHKPETIPEDTPLSERKKRPVVKKITKKPVVMVRRMRTRSNKDALDEEDLVSQEGLYPWNPDLKKWTPIQSTMTTRDNTPEPTTPGLHSLVENDGEVESSQKAEDLIDDTGVINFSSNLSHSLPPKVISNEQDLDDDLPLSSSALTRGRSSKPCARKSNTSTTRKSKTPDSPLKEPSTVTDLESDLNEPPKANSAKSKLPKIILHVSPTRKTRATRTSVRLSNHEKSQIKPQLQRIKVSDSEVSVVDLDTSISEVTNNRDSHKIETVNLIKNPSDNVITEKLPRDSSDERFNQPYSGETDSMEQQEKECDILSTRNDLVQDVPCVSKAVPEVLDIETDGIDVKQENHSVFSNTSQNKNLKDLSASMKKNENCKTGQSLILTAESILFSDDAKLEYENKRLLAVEGIKGSPGLKNKRMDLVHNKKSETVNELETTTLQNSKENIHPKHGTQPLISLHKTVKTNEKNLTITTPTNQSHIPLEETEQKLKLLENQFKSSIHSEQLSKSEYDHRASETDDNRCHRETSINIIKRKIDDNKLMGPSYKRSKSVSPTKIESQRGFCSPIKFSDKYSSCSPSKIPEAPVSVTHVKLEDRLSFGPSPKKVIKSALVGLDTESGSKKSILASEESLSAATATDPPELTESQHGFGKNLIPQDSHTAKTIIPEVSRVSIDHSNHQLLETNKSFSTLLIEEHQNLCNDPFAPEQGHVQTRDSDMSHSVVRGAATASVAVIKGQVDSIDQSEDVVHRTPIRKQQPLLLVTPVREQTTKVDEPITRKLSHALNADNSLKKIPNLVPLDVGPALVPPLPPVFGLKDDQTSKTVSSVTLANNQKTGTQYVDSINTLSSEDQDIPYEILKEMRDIQNTFIGLESKYRLINKIGEGTFSTVYKAESLDKSANYMVGRSEIFTSPELRERQKTKNPPKTYVALKRIYVTSSPQRILNELQLLYRLSNSTRVAPLLDALRFEDQIIAVLPHYDHADFRDFYRDLPLQGVKHYMHELFQALDYVHGHGIIHRDIKPTNFLYHPFTKRGVLVDFGLAESYQVKESVDWTDPNFCPCLTGESYMVEENNRHTLGYIKNDFRSTRRANRAGTRGFRAPEVLFKCPHQTPKIDIWSAGVVLLTFLSRRFPFFNSRDDVDALVELTTVFGVEEMIRAANLHALRLTTDLPSLKPNRRVNLQSVVRFAIHTEIKMDTLPDDSVAYETYGAFDDEYSIMIRDNDSPWVKKNKLEHLNAFQVMDACFKLDPTERLNAREILAMPFFDDRDLKNGINNDNPFQDSSNNVSDEDYTENYEEEDQEVDEDADIDLV